MRWICEQEGIEADDEVLGVLAQAGEGSVRDSLSALDQAIACCGTTLSAAGSSRAARDCSRSTRCEHVAEALERGDAAAHARDRRRSWSATGATCSISAASWRAIFAICWWRASPAARDALDRRLGARSRSGCARWRRGFSEEDLTRYLQLIAGSVSAICRPRCSRACIWRWDCCGWCTREGCCRSSRRSAGLRQAPRRRSPQPARRRLRSRPRRSRDRPVAASSAIPRASRLHGRSPQCRDQRRLAKLREPRLHSAA